MPATPALCHSPPEGTGVGRQEPTPCASQRAGGSLKLPPTPSLSPPGLPCPARLPLAPLPAWHGKLAAASSPQELHAGLRCAHRGEQSQVQLSNSSVAKRACQTPPCPPPRWWRAGRKQGPGLWLGLTCPREGRLQESPLLSLGCKRAAGKGLPVLLQRKQLLLSPRQSSRAEKPSQLQQQGVGRWRALSPSDSGDLGQATPIQPPNPTPHSDLWALCRMEGSMMAQESQGPSWIPLQSGV